MATVKEIYLGDLRVECEHLASGTKIITDAPVDNQGKGEAFSPTDLCATALGACALTIMGIYARNHNIDIVGDSTEVTKHMSASATSKSSSTCRPRVIPTVRRRP